MTYLPADLVVTARSAQPRALHLAIAGDLDYETATRFTHEVNQALDAHHQQYGQVPKDLHLDFSGLAGIDSSALTALLVLRRQAYPAGITLHLDQQPSQMVRMLELTGIADHLTQDAHASPPAADEVDEQTETASAP
ncbi:STAS domain-containing protein [Streptomyces sp. NPDC093071]|uniref:STAS domain-containing protein n=1 Tax=Streptomyces sp. NPDC093071 TaxID=3366022 RepID=UPI00382C9C48